ncbi:hypothetical protein NDU88_011051 [Pleurodeles waltl]|uniref:Uncharacterized protein n=1 Tax=Pleurodeles waltl TaxID=8319 RepID=A0AAV7R0G9_PLEWA|nr:hypothetical protein NDU88_011051 [Pleurodeles waltl]
MHCNAYGSERLSSAKHRGAPLDACGLLGSSLDIAECGLRPRRANVPLSNDVGSVGCRAWPCLVGETACEWRSVRNRTGKPMHFPCTRHILREKAYAAGLCGPREQFPQPTSKPYHVNFNALMTPDLMILLIRLTSR